MHMKVKVWLFALLFLVFTFGLAAQEEGQEQRPEQQRETGQPEVAQDVPKDPMQILITMLGMQKGEVEELRAQAKQLDDLGDDQAASLWHRMIADHQKAVNTLTDLIKRRGGDPNQAKAPHQPVVGTGVEMIRHMHEDHHNAVEKLRAFRQATSDPDIQNFTQKAIATTTKHIEWMERLGVVEPSPTP